MRYTRLRRAIEGGTLIGTHGTPFQGTPEKVAKAQQKRKKPVEGEMTADGDDIGPIHTRSGKRIIRKPRESTGSSEGAVSDSSDECNTPTPAKHRAMVYEQTLGRSMPALQTAMQEQKTEAVHGTGTKSKSRHSAPRMLKVLTSPDHTVESLMDCGEDSRSISPYPKLPSTGQSAAGFDRGWVLEPDFREGEKVEADVK